MLAEIQSSVHSPAAKDATAAGSANEPKIISAISSHADYFMENYLLVKVGSQILMHITLVTTMLDNLR